MNLNFIKKLNICSLRNPKIIKIKDKYIIIGSSVYEKNNDKIKYILYYYILNDTLEIFKDKKILNIDQKINNINISLWLRDIYYDNNYYYLNIEYKKNDTNKFTQNNILYKTINFETFIKIKEYNNFNFLLFKEIDNTLIQAELFYDEDNCNFIWGKYLFKFNKNGDLYYPKFDKNIDYFNDKGHLIHNIIPEKGCYKILLSIRKKYNEYYKYDIYVSYTNNFVDFYNTMKINFDYEIDFIAYPCYLKINNKEYLICNQNDFGKNSKLLLFRFDY